VANYNVDIAVAIKGAQKLSQFNKNIKQTTKEIAIFNQTVLNAAKNEDALIKSVNNLSHALADSKRNFNEVALGTGLASRAAKEYLTALRNTNAALAEQKAAVVSLQNARKSDAFFLAQGAIAGRQNRLDETQSQATSVAIARANNTRIQAELANQELLKEVQTRAPRLPAFQERGLERLEDEFKKKKELTTLEENANKASKRRLNFQEKQNQELDRQKKLGIGINKNEKLINASHKDRVKFAERNGKIRRQALIRANNLLLAEKKITEQRAKQNQTTAAGGSGRRIGSTASSAIIGGAFPLLFGQTGAAAVGGGLGGLAGGAIGGQFGFALSILGTALGSAIDKNEKFNKSLAALNVQFLTTSGGTQVLAADVDKLAKRLSITKEEAIAALGAFKEFGSGSVAKSLVSIFGTDSGALDTLALTNRQAVLAQQIFDTRKQIGNQVAKQLLQQNLVNDQSTIELALAEAKAKALNDEAIAKAKVITFTDRLKASEDELLGIEGGAARFGEARAKKIQEEFDKNRNKRLEDFKDSLREVRELLGLVNEANGQFGQSGVLAFSAITDKVKDLQDEMKRLQNPISQVILLSESIARSFEDSFVGIIKGTMSVGDAFRNMLNVIADEFIRTAARTAANQFQQGILGFFSSMFSPVKAIPKQSSTGPLGNFDFGMAADGGRIPGGRPTLVGERGPELFTPGVSGMVTPNHALGGSTSIVVNVDASGSSVEGDEQQGRELGLVLSAAIESELIKQKRPGGLLA